MNKQTYPIPDGCKAISMEIIDNKIVTTFEPAQEHPEFKSGDVLITKNSGVFIFNHTSPYDNNYIHTIASINRLGNFALNHPKFCHFEDIYRHATPEEAQRLWDALAKEGKRWNPETMQVEEIKKEIPKANHLSFYYFVSDLDFSINDCMENIHLQDGMRHKAGNYFLSEDQAQRAAEKLKAALADFWKEELK